MIITGTLNRYLRCKFVLDLYLYILVVAPNVQCIILWEAGTNPEPASQCLYVPTMLSQEKTGTSSVVRPLAPDDITSHHVSTSHRSSDPRRTVNLQRHANMNLPGDVSKQLG